MFALAALFQQAGWLLSIGLMLLVAVWTAQSSLYFAQAMAAFRGNANFGKRMEMGHTMFHLLPRWAYYLGMVTLLTVFFSQNLANIVLTSQVMDYTLLDMFGRTCGVDYYPSFRAYCVTGASSQDAQTDSPFGYSYVISLGYIVVLVLCIPLGVLNLDDNIGIQIAGMLLTVVCVFVWVADFMRFSPTIANMPALPPDSSALPTLLSTVVFNYGFVATIPSWLNEKAPKVQVARTVWGGVLWATSQFLLVSVPAAMAVPNLPSSCTLLAVINGVCPVPDANGDGGNLNLPFWAVSRIMVFIFPIANVLASIPVFSIIIRYNLLQIHGIKVPVWLGNLFAVVLPWLVALPFFGGDGLNQIINWSSAIFFILLNLILPLWAYLKQAHLQAQGLPPIDASQVELEASEGAEAAAGSLNAGAGASGRATGMSFLQREASARLLAVEERAGSSSGGGGGYEGAGGWEGPSELLLGGNSLNAAGEEGEGDSSSSSGEGKVSAMPWLCGVQLSTGVEVGYATALLLVSMALAVATLALQIYLALQPTDDGRCVERKVQGGRQHSHSALSPSLSSLPHTTLSLTHTHTHPSPPHAAPTLAAAIALATALRWQWTWPAACTAGTARSSREGAFREEERHGGGALGGPLLSQPSCYKVLIVCAALHPPPSLTAPCPSTAPQRAAHTLWPGQQ